MNVIIVNFDPFNVSLLNTSINFFIHSFFLLSLYMCVCVYRPQTFFLTLPVAHGNTTDLTLLTYKYLVVQNRPRSSLTIDVLAGGSKLSSTSQMSDTTGAENSPEDTTAQTPLQDIYLI